MGTVGWGTFSSLSAGLERALALWRVSGGSVGLGGVAGQVAWLVGAQGVGILRLGGRPQRRARPSRPPVGVPVQETQRAAAPQPGALFRDSRHPFWPFHGPSLHRPKPCCAQVSLASPSFVGRPTGHRVGRQVPRARPRQPPRRGRRPRPRRVSTPTPGEAGTPPHTHQIRLPIRLATHPRSVSNICASKVIAAMSTTRCAGLCLPSWAM